MIAEFLQEVLNQFSLRTLYLGMLWFATFGYLMHLLVVTVITKLPLSALPKSIARLHGAAMVSSYVVAPVCAAASFMLSKLYAPFYMPSFLGQQVYVWFTVCMMLFSSFALCTFFATVPCSRFRWWLAAVNGMVGLLGLFVLKALNLLKML